MAPVERNTIDFLAEQRFELILELMKSRHSQRVLERRSVHSICLSRFFVRSISIVLCTKLLSHDLNAFWCVRSPSCDAKSMLNVATFLKTAAEMTKAERDLTKSSGHTFSFPQI